MPGSPSRDPPAVGGEPCYFDLAGAAGPDASTRSLHVAVVGADPAPILDGFRHFPGTEVVLLHARQDADAGARLLCAFEDAAIRARLVEAPGDAYGGTLLALNALVLDARLAYARILVNVSSGTPATACAALTAAYLHGLAAFHVDGERAGLLPILPIGARTLLGEDDVALVGLLAEAPRTVRGLARRARLSPRRVRARLEGSPERPGLLALGLLASGHGVGPFRTFALTPTGRAWVTSGALVLDPPKG